MNWNITHDSKVIRLNPRNKIKLNRYRGKTASDAILAEICWWSKAIFKEREENENEGEASVDVLVDSDDLDWKEDDTMGSGDNNCW